MSQSHHNVGVHLGDLIVPRGHSCYIKQYLQLLSLYGIITGEFQLFLCVYIYCPVFFSLNLDSFVYFVIFNFFSYIGA